MLRRVLMLVPIALTLAACGGGGGLTKAQYDAKVSRLCQLAADGLRELHLGNSVAAWRHSGPTVVRIADHFDKSLAALKAPSGIAAQAAVFLKANEKLAGGLQGGRRGRERRRPGEAPRRRESVQPGRHRDLPVGEGDRGDGLLHRVVRAADL